MQSDYILLVMSWNKMKIHPVHFMQEMNSAKQEQVQYNGAQP